jgi:4-hydroxy-3-polyprenylbenzoate decarboxylase
MYYRDLREYLAALRARGLLVEIDAPVDKNRELQPLVRLQFQHLPEAQRRAFLFRNVTDASGRRYEPPVLIGHTAASRDVYALGLGCTPEEIDARWGRALREPLSPTPVGQGPVQEVVLRGADLDSPGGLESLPVPIATPGWDNAPYTSASHWVTKDPETGVRNVGNYRGMIKSSRRLGCFAAAAVQGLRRHWLKARAEGRPHLEAAIVIGVTPNLTYAATTRLPLDVDEYAIAGGLVGQPLALVRCQTVDLEVPATAEIVIEGTIPTDALESEGPFGEFTGYMAKRGPSIFLNVQCITRRRDAIYAGILSQFPPSESSKLRQIGVENVLKWRLAREFALPEVLDVGLDEYAGSVWLCAIQLARVAPEREDAVRAGLHKLATTWPGKFYLLVDEDVDVHDSHALLWALTGRVQPHRDITILSAGTVLPLDQSLLSPEAYGEPSFFAQPRFEGSVAILDARRRWAYPPVSLPPEPILARARTLWQELGLPELPAPTGPTHGYSLGNWSERDAEEAAAAQAGVFLAAERAEQERTALPPESASPAGPPRRSARGGPAAS